MFTRTELLIGHNALEKLKKSRVAVFGLGGVGGYVVEALVRGGIGSIDITDNDKVDITNLNRQIIALNSTLGQYKTDAMGKRVLDINPNINLKKYNLFYMPETSDVFEFDKYDYIVDATDTVTAKISLVEQAKKHGVPIICAMGAGNKLNPKLFEVADISKTSVCPLAKVMRHELKKRNIKGVKVVYSKEPPIKQPEILRKSPGSNSVVPAVVGLLIANEIIKDIVESGESSTF